MFLLLQSPEILLFINHEVCATLKGYVFLRRFGAESVMGTTEVHERINLSFGFQMNKKKRVSCKCEMDFKKCVGSPI